MFITLLHRIEKEIMALEAQELDISANEEVVLKRLKEVERTAEDIIKVGSNYLAAFRYSACCTSSYTAVCFSLIVIMLQYVTVWATKHDDLTLLSLTTNHLC